MVPIMVLVSASAVTRGRGMIGVERFLDDKASRKEGDTTC
jgi:hypothetical protein